MKYFAVFFVAVLAFILVMSNAAPQGASASESAQGEGSVGMSAGFGVGGSAGASAGGSGGASSGVSSLVKRDLANHAPIAHHLHTASCNGQWGGQGPPPGPPPNATSSG